MPAGESCGTCKHWLRFPSEPVGQGSCRRHAPLPGSASKALWPTTLEVDWCGEYQKENPPE
jgi:hypothetical protein